MNSSEFEFQRVKSNRKWNRSPSYSSRKRSRILARLQHSNGTITLCHFNPNKIYESCMLYFQKALKSKDIHLIYLGTSKVIKHDGRTNRLVDETVFVDMFTARICNYDSQYDEGEFKPGFETIYYDDPSESDKNLFAMKHFQNAKCKIRDIYGSVMYISKSTPSNTRNQLERFEYVSFREHLWTCFDQMKTREEILMDSPFSIMWDMWPPLNIDQPDDFDRESCGPEEDELPNATKRRLHSPLPISI